MRRISEAFALPIDEGVQDWDIELADPTRLAEFIQHFDLLESDNDRRALFALVIASFDDLLAEGQTNSILWAFVVQLVADASAELYQDIIDYWSCDEDRAPADCFAVTPIVRKLRIVT